MEDWQDGEQKTVDEVTIAYLVIFKSQRMYIMNSIFSVINKLPDCCGKAHPLIPAKQILRRTNPKHICGPSLL